MKMGNHASALQPYDRVLGVYERKLPPKDPLRLKAVGKKANALMFLGRLGESLPLFKAAVKAGRQALPEDSDELSFLEESLALNLANLDEHEEAAVGVPNPCMMYAAVP